MLSAITVYCLFKKQPVIGVNFTNDGN